MAVESAPKKNEQQSTPQPASGPDSPESLLRLVTGGRTTASHSSTSGKATSAARPAARPSRPAAGGTDNLLADDSSVRIFRPDLAAWSGSSKGDEGEMRSADGRQARSVHAEEDGATPSEQEKKPSAGGQQVRSEEDEAKARAALDRAKSETPAGGGQTPTKLPAPTDHTAELAAPVDHRSSAMLRASAGQPALNLGAPPAGARKSILRQLPERAEPSAGSGQTSGERESDQQGTASEGAARTQPFQPQGDAREGGRSGRRSSTGLGTNRQRTSGLGRHVADYREELDGLVEQLQGECAQHRASAQASAEEQTTALEGAAEQKIAELQGSLAEQMADNEARHATAAGELDSLAATAKADVDARIDADIAQVKTSLDGEIATLEAEFGQRQARVRDAIAQQRTQHQGILEGELTRVATRINEYAAMVEATGAAQQARGLTGIHRQAVRTLTDTTRGLVRDQLPKIEEGVRARAAHTLQAYQTGEQQATQELEQQKALLIPGLRERLTGTLDELEQRRASLHASIDDTTRAERERLQGAQEDTAAQLQKRSDVAVQSVHDAKAAALVSVDEKLSTAETRLDGLLSTTAEQIQVSGLGDARLLYQNANVHITEISTQTGTALEETGVTFEAVVTSTLDAALADFSAIVGDASQRAASARENVQLGFDEQLQAQAQEIQQKLDEMNAQREGLVGDALSDIEQSIAGKHTTLQEATLAFQREVSQSAEQPLGKVMNVCQVSFPPMARTLATTWWNFVSLSLLPYYQGRLRSQF